METESPEVARAMLIKLEGMKKLVDDMLMILSNQYALCLPEGSVKLGFHYLGTVPLLHMHVLIGDLTNMAYDKENAQRWVSYDIVHKYWSNKI